MFDRVGIIGFGLIGSSLARGVRQAGLAHSIIAIDASAAVCARAVELGIADESHADMAAGVAGCDLVILAVPVGQMAGVMTVIAAHLKPGCIVTDTGSVKQAVIDAVLPHIREGVLFVPGHPIAGTEKSGPDAGFAELFKGRWCILTPLPDTDAGALAALQSFWEKLGSNVVLMDPRRHDLTLGITSHLPHLIAYTIVGTATDLEDHLKADVIRFSAGGFRDFTRIAASNPVMWRDVFLNNQDAVLEVLQRFSEDLTALQKAIRRGDGGTLEEWFTRTRAVRQAVIDQGQAGDHPASLHSGQTQPEAAPRTNARR